MSQVKANLYRTVNVSPDQDTNINYYIRFGFIVQKLRKETHLP